jgi:rhodanese-related sulfurtransferase
MPLRLARKEPLMSAEISLEELDSLIRSGRPPTLVEVLPEASFAAGHLPGALNLPLPKLPAAARALLPDPAAQIVVYCSGPTCANSHVAEGELSRQGYRHVRVFRGGKSAWQDAGHPLEAAS